MPRQVRIEYEGALYHVMARGNRRDLYLRTLLDYIHRNPVRARIVPSESCGGLLDYAWSSLAKALNTLRHSQSNP